eukprot:2264554-Rhodomonas_salina.2
MVMWVWGMGQSGMGVLVREQARQRLSVAAANILALWWRRRMQRSPPISLPPSLALPRSLSPSLSLAASRSLSLPLSAPARAGCLCLDLSLALSCSRSLKHGVSTL